MMQDQGRAGSGAPAPLPVDSSTARQQPVPLGVPVRKRSKWPLVVAVSVILLLVGTCIGMFYLVNGVSTEDVSYGPWPIPSYFSEYSGAVAWSGGGRYGVVQYFGEGGVPAVAVWDAETDEVETRMGYLVAGVEREGAQIWLVPVEQVDGSYDGFGDIVDHQPAELLVWDLDDFVGPTADAPARWSAWPGPGAYTAYLEVDALKGCMPSRLLINNNEGSGEGVKAALPESTVTYAPVGWSPSGEYFAVEELLDAYAHGLLASPTDPVSDLDEDTPVRKVLVFSAETGELVAEGELPVGATSVPVTTWGADDVLYWVDTDPILSGDYTEDIEAEMYSLAPGSDAERYVIPEDTFESSWGVLPLGSDASGALLHDSTGSIWLLGTDGIEHFGGLSGADYATWDPRGGILVARAETTYVDDTSSRIAMHLLLFDKNGAGQKTVWTGPEVARTDF